MTDVHGAVVRRFDVDYSRGNRLLLGVLGLGPRFSYVVLDDTHLHVRMGWGFKASIPLSGVVRVTASERPFWAWGVHGWRGRWLVNGSSQGIVAIEIDPPERGRAMYFPLRLRTVYVSLTDRGRFIAAVAGQRP